MLLYLLLIIILIFMYNSYFIEGFKPKKRRKNKRYVPKLEFTCEDKHNVISSYQPNNENTDVYAEKHIDLLFTAKFKPECCPSPYSTSSGCLCLDRNHTSLIKMRGGNRITC
jgi:hypothetical protein